MHVTAVLLTACAILPLGAASMVDEFCKTAPKPLPAGETIDFEGGIDVGSAFKMDAVLPTIVTYSVDCRHAIKLIKVCTVKDHKDAKVPVPIPAAKIIAMSEKFQLKKKKSDGTVDAMLKCADISQASLLPYDANEKKTYPKGMADIK